MTPVPRTQRRPAFYLGLTLLVVALVLMLIGLFIGSSGLDISWEWWQRLAPAQFADSLHQNKNEAMRAQIIWDIRAPRTLGAFLAGALLALSGALAQGVFRNPLADPYLLGSAAGASLGIAALLITLLHFNPLTVGTALFGGSAWLSLGFTGIAFFGSTLAVALTVILARGVQHTLRLLLAGLVVGVVLGALTALLSMRTPAILQAMQAFALGSTAFIAWPAVGLMALVWLVCALMSSAAARGLDGLVLGDDTARSLGVPVVGLRALLILVLALASGTAVAQTGLIAFIGLAAPHLVRGLVRTRHASLMLLSSLMGGVLLLAADLLARALIAPQELPVGVLTALLGGSYLLYLMHKGNLR